MLVYFENNFGESQYLLGDAQIFSKLQIIKGRFRVNTKTVGMNKSGDEIDDFSTVDSLPKSKHESLVLEGFDENAQAEVNNLVSPWMDLLKSTERGFVVHK